MKVPKKYYIWLGIGMVMLIAFEFYKKKDVDWEPTYSSYDQIPYGTEVNYTLLAEGKWNNIIERTNKTFYQYYIEDSSNYSCIFMANKVFFDDESYSKLMNHVSKGNTVLIAANTMPLKLLEHFNIELKDAIFNKKENLIKLENGISFIDTLTNIFNTERFTYFEWNDSSTNVKQLGSRINKPDFIEIEHGKGKFILHLNPLLFTNYYLLQEISFQYVNSVFSLMPRTRIVWDDFMNYGQKKPQSEMRIVLSSLPMRIAFYLLTFLLVIYLGLAWRRKQKMIPVIEPLKNSSIDFIDTLTNLYLSNKNNGIIASYLAKNFRIKTNRKYQIQWNKPIGIIKAQLITKSGRSEFEVNQLLNKLNISEQQKPVSQTELIELNKTIEEFISK